MTDPTPQSLANTDLLYGRLNAIEFCVEQLWTQFLLSSGSTPDQVRELGASIARRAENSVFLGRTEDVSPERNYAMLQHMIGGIEQIFERIAVDLEQRAAGIVFPDN